MPAPKQRFYSTADIMEILSVSKAKANQIMHYFEMRGKLLRDGKLMRVAIIDFETWITDHTTTADKTVSSRLRA